MCCVVLSQICRVVCLGGGKAVGGGHGGSGGGG